jgi:hypothetical protein
MSRLRHQSRPTAQEEEKGIELAEIPKTAEADILRYKHYKHLDSHSHTLQSQSFSEFILGLTCYKKAWNFDTLAMEKQGYNRAELDMFLATYHIMVRSHPLKAHRSQQTTLDICLITHATEVQQRITQGRLNREQAVRALNDRLRDESITATLPPSGFGKTFREPRVKHYETSASQLAQLSTLATQRRNRLAERGELDDTEWESKYDIVKQVNKTHAIV